MQTWSRKIPGAFGKLDGRLEEAREKTPRALDRQAILEMASGRCRKERWRMEDGGARKKSVTTLVCCVAVTVSRSWS